MKGHPLKGSSPFISQQLGCMGCPKSKVREESSRTWHAISLLGDDSHARWFHGENLIWEVWCQGPRGLDEGSGEHKVIRRIAIVMSCKVGRAKGVTRAGPKEGSWDHCLQLRNRDRNPLTSLFLPPTTPATASHWPNLIGSQWAREAGKCSFQGSISLRYYVLYWGITD